MAERWAATVVGSSDLVLVVYEFIDDKMNLIADETWRLQRGEVPEAYAQMHERTANYIHDNHIHTLVVKGSAVGRNAARMAHLEAAQLRGIVIAAASLRGAKVQIIQKATASRTFGERNVDDYVNDEAYWKKYEIPQLRKGSREATILLLNARAK